MIKRALNALAGRLGISLIHSTKLGQLYTELGELRTENKLLQAESDRLQTENSRLQIEIDGHRIENDRLPAEKQQLEPPTSVDPLVGEMASILFWDLKPSERHDLQFFDRLYKLHGALRSTADFGSESKLAAVTHFHFKEKAEVALTAASSWYGGDYFEFGAHDLNTFRNMLTAYDICVTPAYPDVRFYAFDIFGNTAAGSSNSDGGIDATLEDYFAPFTKGGDQIELHREYIAQHNLFTDKCILVQGLFENTLTREFKAKYKAEQRKIGFAFIDCNAGPSYKLVFEFIFDIMGESSYVYMDEYFQCVGIVEYFEQFQDELRRKRNMGCVYIRNAAGFGGLFRLFPLGTLPGKLDLKIN